MKRQYYSMEKSGNEANINIYGDITSWAWEELGEVSAVNLSKQLEELGEVSQINVFINSYGGEVAEGLAIYNALKRHKAKVKTVCDGFACSIASVIFMAGDERIMNDSSLLMIHNAWTYAVGNSDQLRKQADDLEKITQASVTAYKAHSSLSEKEIKALMDNETWILPEEALGYGFATTIEKSAKAEVSQSAKMQLLDIIKKFRAEAEDEDEPEEEEKPETDDETEENEGEAGDGEENTEDEEPEEEDEETPEDEEPEDKPEEKLSKIFNAILKM